MLTRPQETCPDEERLSALLDGEIEAGDSARACASWCDRADARRDWHAWHLIGDVLRSDELASDAARDVRFLLAVRARLAGEPVVLAPAPLLRPAAPLLASRAGRWLLPSAVAAGLVMVVGAFGVLRSGPQPGESPAVAVAANIPAPSSPQVPSGTAGDVVALTNPTMIRDAQLQRYLAAHKQFAGTSALGVPSAFLRSATLEAPAR
ncbi:MAG: sigma-E factor negative regulatory protein [Caldimonas sp.]